MIGEEKDPKQTNDQPLGRPSEGPLKNEPTPERAREEKDKQAQEACPQGS